MIPIETASKREKKENRDRCIDSLKVIHSLPAPLPWSLSGSKQIPQVVREDPGCCALFSWISFPLRYISFFGPLKHWFHLVSSFFKPHSFLSFCSMTAAEFNSNNNKNKVMDAPSNNGNSNESSSTSTNNSSNNNVGIAGAGGGTGTMTRMHPSMKRPRAPIACFRCHHKKVLMQGKYVTAWKKGWIFLFAAYI